MTPDPEVVKTVLTDYTENGLTLPGWTARVVPTADQQMVQIEFTPPLELHIDLMARRAMSRRVLQCVLQILKKVKQGNGSNDLSPRDMLRLADVLKYNVNPPNVHTANMPDPANTYTPFCCLCHQLFPGLSTGFAVENHMRILLQDKFGESYLEDILPKLLQISQQRIITMKKRPFAMP